MRTGCNVFGHSWWLRSIIAGLPNIQQTMNLYEQWTIRMWFNFNDIFRGITVNGSSGFVRSQEYLTKTAFTFNQKKVFTRLRNYVYEMSLLTYWFSNAPLFLINVREDSADHQLFG